jgi:hypothetical protein
MMRVVRLQASSVGDAEKFVAEVWRALEAENIDTPEMAVRDCGGVMIIELLFASSQDANLILETLPSVSTAREMSS